MNQPGRRPAGVGRRQARTGLLPAAALFLLLAGAGDPAPAAVAVGEVPPGFTLAGLDAQAVSLASLQGKVVYLAFWASWCPACQQELPWLQDMQQRYGSRGFQAVAVNLDQKRADADAFLAEHHLPQLQMAFDPANRTPRIYGVGAMPTAMLVGRDGRVRRIRAGRWQARDAVAGEAAIRAALDSR